MAAGQVSRAPRGFTLVELVATVAIAAAMIAMASTALTSARKVAKVGGQARLILQRLQSVRTQAVSQGAAQGYYFGPSGPGASGADANKGFIFWKLNPTDTAVSYAPGVDRADALKDTLPLSGNNSVVVVTGAGVAQPAPFSIGFDMNGQVTVTPGPVLFPYCIQVTDVVEPGIIRYVILFDDGTTKVQGDETWCP